MLPYLDCNRSLPQQSATQNLPQHLQRFYSQNHSLLQSHLFFVCGENDM